MAHITRRFQIRAFLDALVIAVNNLVELGREREKKENVLNHLEDSCKKQCQVCAHGVIQQCCFESRSCYTTTHKKRMWATCHYQECTQCFVDEIIQIHCEFGSVIDTGSMNETSTSACPLLMDRLHVVQSEDVDRNLGEMKDTEWVQDSFPFIS